MAHGWQRHLVASGNLHSYSLEIDMGLHRPDSDRILRFRRYARMGNKEVSAVHILHPRPTIPHLANKKDFQSYLSHACGTEDVTAPIEEGARVRYFEADQAQPRLFLKQYS